MIAELFSTLSQWISGSPAVALTAAFVWGVLSIVLSPCHLASIPLIVAYIGRGGPTSTMRAFLLASLFSFGILLTIAAIGVITALAGRMMGDLGAWCNYVVAAVMLVVALWLWEVLPTPWTAPKGAQQRAGSGWLGAFLLGLIFGLALGPCTFAFMAPVLAVTFSLAATDWWYAMALLLVYGIGHCLVIAIAGGATGLVQRYLAWSEDSSGALWMKRACGLLVALAGLYMLWTAP